MVCAITGASGYVGSVLAEALSQQFRVIPILRRHSGGAIQWELGQPSDISQKLREYNVKTVIHAAWDFSHPDARENERVNVEGSARLFESARRAGVERIVFISTISAFPEAHSIYGKSKMRVERMVLEDFSGAVIRPGLVWGDALGGMFGSLNQQVEHSKLIPLIGSGRYPQYLIHQDDLARAVLRAATGDWNTDTAVTVANPQPWLLKDLIRSIAEGKGRKISLVPMPWPAVYLALKLVEVCGIKSNFRSDSVLSLVYQNSAPDFSPAERLGLERRAYSGSHRS